MDPSVKEYTIGPRKPFRLLSLADAVLTKLQCIKPGNRKFDQAKELDKCINKEFLSSESEFYLHAQDPFGVADTKNLTITRFDISDHTEILLMNSHPSWASFDALRSALLECKSGKIDTEQKREQCIIYILDRLQQLAPTLQDVLLKIIQLSLPKTHATALNTIMGGGATSSFSRKEEQIDQNPFEKYFGNVDPLDDDRLSGT